MTRDQDPFGKVVAMTQVDFGAGRRATAELRAYWEALRNGRPVPARSDVDPRGIQRSLDYAFILERVAPGMARFRLAGMHLNDLMGMEVRGMPMTAMFVPQGRQRLADAMERVFKDPAVAELTLNAETGIGKPPLSARLLLLPLKSDFGDVTRAMGCLVAEGPIGRTPRRFEVASVEVGPILTGVTDLRDLPAPARAPTFAEPPRPFTPAPNMTPEQRRAQLRLVKSED